MAIKQCTERWCAPHWAHVESVCAQCGIAFQGHAKTLARGHGRFCSRTCAMLARPPRPLLTREERVCRSHGVFWRRVNKTDTCWRWTGPLDVNGYGQFGGLFAHRVSWLLTYGGMPPLGLELDHLCRVPACVRPEHLDPVTHRENILRGMAPIATNARRSHCRFGHLLVARHGPRPGNPGGTRYCAECDTLRQRSKRARRRADGLCGRCGSPSAPGRSVCATHINHARPRTAH